MCDAAGMGYSEMKRCWDDVRRRTVDDVRTALLEHRATLELEGEPGAVLTGAGEDHVLVVVGVDADGIIALSMVPTARVGATLRDALESIDGRVFAGSADLTPEQWDAAVLVMSALAFEMNDADELADWAADDGSSLDADQIRAVWNCWSDTAVNHWSQLERPVSRVYSLRRAM